MSVPYTWKVATNRPTAFFRLLLRWKGTIYRYIIFEFCMFLLVYSILSLTYRFILSEQSKRNFEYYCLYCARRGRLVPIGLVLGFFVDVVVKRWWEQYRTIPWPDEAIMLLSAYVTDNSELTRHKLKTILRYMNLTYIIALRGICPKVKQRYLDQNLLADGLITPGELKRIESSAPKRKPPFYAIPMFWAVHLVNEMRHSGVIASDFAVELIIKELVHVRRCCARLRLYNMITIPIGFPHVATITIYSYFVASIFVWQFLDVNQKYSHRLVDLYIPVLGILQLIFFLGWLKVAQALINPWGEDADDFAVNKYVERNLQMSNFLIEKLHDEAPPLMNGVILSSVMPLKRKPVKDPENRSPTPAGLLAQENLSHAAASLFMGSVASADIETRPNLLRRTISHYEQVK